MTMDRDAVWRAWDEVSETYANQRDPTGSDADLLADLVDLVGADATVLDVGCGDGARTLANLPDGSVGLDVSRRGLELARDTVGHKHVNVLVNVRGHASRRPRNSYRSGGITCVRQYETVPGARLLQGEMTQLPVAADSVDAITAYHAVFHVPRADHPAVYREFARVLRPGGTLLMTLPGGRFETVREGWMGGRMLFSAPGREATLSQLREAGFTDVRTRTVTDPLGSDAEFAFADFEGE